MLADVSFPFPFPFQLQLQFQFLMVLSLIACEGGGDTNIIYGIII